MQTAITAINSTSIVITWDPSPGHVNQFFPILHISEILDLSGTNQSRQFNIYVNGLRWPGDINIMTPPYLCSNSVYSLGPLPSSPTYNISLEALSNSTLPPILNAFELYMTISNTSVPSDAGDGMYPHLCNNGTLCNEMPTPMKKKISTPVVVVIVILCIVLMVLILNLAVITRVWRVTKTQGLRRGNSVDQHNGFLKQTDNALQLENRQFTYMELQNITNNFQKILGKGGFGSVFHGHLEDGTQVAVKMRSQSSSQGTKEFLAEAQHLTRVHHRNLVSLVGYCSEVNHLALVYEFMSQGTLHDHLQGRANNARALSWRQRLHIAIDAAQGLEYLQNGCKPPLVHRDVKSGNILLSETLEAKIADFGLSKAFLSEANSHISTVVVGTPGYHDPEYYNTFQLSNKSDVYSYGVVLLELITGLPPIVQGIENVHLTQWVLQRLARGYIEDIVDPRLEGEYDINSVWKCANIALKCTTERSQQRPTMTEVVMQLKESLKLENSHDNTVNKVAHSENLDSEVSDVSQKSILEIGVSRLIEISGPTIR
ncbi:probable LRR receptor-like serine/threonine-protein kinase At1g05700 [Zingiber officinale]|uniref:probable LRR receptor-like serine/threonine-protein kinase At1g05700 n=1 Tax=Zingiber officinale TaxID=94328 RepID=UPI001C4D72E4|nr:probable LRR receptor-like serine/threonine-protein kinase At1g05700 [Zingiber officinale]